MAKVVMPLLSAEASGRIASAIVYFTWKGINCVRQWTVPTNPRDIDQKIIRQKVACVGKYLKQVVLPGVGILNGSKMYQLLRADSPSGQIWNAWLAKNVLGYIKTNSNFVALSSALFGGTPAALTCWQTSATSIGLEDITGVPFATTISPELQLFAAAYGVYLRALSSVTYKYNDHPTTWVEAKIIAFKDDTITTA